MILAHMRYRKGSKKPKNKGKNPYYIPYHRADVVGGDAGPVPMELGKTTLKYWTNININSVDLWRSTLLMLASSLHQFFFFCALEEEK